MNFIRWGTECSSLAWRGVAWRDSKQRAHRVQTLRGITRLQCSSIKELKLRYLGSSVTTRLGITRHRDAVRTQSSIYAEVGDPSGATPCCTAVGLQFCGTASAYAATR